MPGGGQTPMCKESATGGVIPGICAGVGALVLAALITLIVYAVYRSRRKTPVPTEEPDDAPLKESKYTSGRPLPVNSTVYEVYYPICSQNGVLNKDLPSVRCTEDLRWNASIQGL
uniref:Uncharacterized protein n=1 Tax=Magallana gigas TaxID=29159 RepID=K1QND8_MAGGI